MASQRKNLPPESRTKIKRFEDKLKEIKLGEVRGNVGDWWCASVPLPHLKFNDGNELCEILKDKTGLSMRNRAIEAANRITEYIKITESIWREIESAS